MSSSRRVAEEKIDQVLREKAKLEKQLQHLSYQLKHYLYLKKRSIQNSEEEYEEEDSDFGYSFAEKKELPSTSSSKHNRRRPAQEEKLDFQIELLEFRGELNPEIFLDWLQTVERVFDLLNIQDEEKVKLVALKLRSYASTWWSNQQRRRVEIGEPRINTWQEMRHKLKEKFLPRSYMKDNYFKLQHHIQGNLSVEEYTKQFEYLLWRCDLKEDETQTLVRYIAGLNDNIRNVVELYACDSLDELSSLAYKVEKQKQKKSKEILADFQPDPYLYYSPQNQPSPTKIPPTNQSPTKQPAVPQNQQLIQPLVSRRRCFKCQGLGHIAAECPNQKIVSFEQYQAAMFLEAEPEREEEQQGWSGEPVYDEIEAAPDEGELLVLRRVLNGGSLEEEQTQREDIFQTQCTIQGKICSLIVDGGSCANIASQTMVSKLALPSSPHPSPYSVHWINQHQGINITHRCLLNFSIGKSYQDSIWCDILPIDVSHVILGRPWLFDHAVSHDGRANTYTFLNHQKKITLKPHEPGQSFKPQKNLSQISSLRTNFFQQGEDDVYPSSKNYTQSYSRSREKVIMPHLGKDVT